MAEGLDVAARFPGGVAPDLVGVRGRLRIVVGEQPVGTLAVDDGRVELTDASGPSDAQLFLSSADDLRPILRGEANPVVVALRGRLELQGDLAFGIKALLGLRGQGG